MGKEAMEVSKFQEDLYFLPAVGEGYKQEYWVKLMFGHIYFYNKYDRISALPLVNLTKEQLELIWNQVNKL